MKWTTGIALFAVLMMPAAFAAEASATAQAVTVWDLRFRQIGQAFDDFAFGVKSALTFDQKAKVDLLKERVAEIKARQHAWLEMKANAMENFSKLSEQEKKDVIATLRAEHEAIMKQHLHLGNEVAGIRLHAMAEAKHDIESEAEEAAELEENSGLSLGLGLDAEEHGSLTAEQARTLVQSRLGIDGTVTTETTGGKTIYVVSGTKTETVGNYELSRNYEVQVDAATGAIVSADMNTHLLTVSIGAASASASGSASAEGSGSAGTSGSTTTGASAGANAGTASGGASANAQASGGVTLGI